MATSGGDPCLTTRLNPPNTLGSLEGVHVQPDFIRPRGFPDRLDFSLELGSVVTLPDLRPLVSCSSSILLQRPGSSSGLREHQQAGAEVLVVARVGRRWQRNWANSHRLADARRCCTARASPPVSTGGVF